MSAATLLDAPSLTGLAQIHLDVTLDGDLPVRRLWDSGTVDLAANLGDVLSQVGRLGRFDGCTPPRRG